MITNTGKSILAKYLVGQSPSYASYIAIGCGAKPLSGLSFAITNRGKVATVATLTSENHGLSIGQVVDVVGLGSEFDGTFMITALDGADKFSYETISGSVSEHVYAPDATPIIYGYAYPNFKNKTTLDFEMLRVPIISRGYVTEEGTALDEFGNLEKISKLVLTAELPTAERYEISEIGVFSAAGNSLAANLDSRPLYSFSVNEGWAYHSATTNVATTIPSIPGRLDVGGAANSIADDSIKDTNGVKYPVFQAQGSNGIFLSDYRTRRFEQPRYLDNNIFMAGNSAKLSVNDFGVMSVVPTWTDGDTFKSNHIHLSNARLALDSNSVLDELRFAFSIVSKSEDAALENIPNGAKVMLEFSSSDAYGEGQYARLEVDLYDINIADADLPNSGYRKNVIVDDLSKNRYFSVSKKLEELTKSAGFSWDIVKNIKIYSCVLDSTGDPSDQFFVCLDGLRFENVSIQNPLYGLTGYTIVNNNDYGQPRTLIKSPNSTNYVEFRFAVDV